MNSLIESKLTEVHALCKKYHVARLELFGSATTDQWDPQTSDLDFLVTFNEPPVGMGPFAQYMDLLLAMQKMFARPVDLVVERAMKNPYFIRRVNESRSPLYVAA